MPALLYQLLGVFLFAFGVHALVMQPGLIRKILALNVMGVGTFMVFVATGYRGAGQAADPVPHAIVLTGIVVAVSATAFALALFQRLHASGSHLVLPEDASARPPTDGI